jgi:hypothetical protein
LAASLTAAAVASSTGADLTTFASGISAFTASTAVTSTRAMMPEAPGVMAGAQDRRIVML